MPREPDPQAAKYVYLDVVRFSLGRSVEAQTDIVAALNEQVSIALAVMSLGPEDRILLPTGDGLCIAILKASAPYDIHLSLALSILNGINSYNSGAIDNSRKFAVRIGINQNVDNVVEDINGRRNIAGTGINTAQRLMSQADGNQIMVGSAVHEMLAAREKYMKHFRTYRASVKHGVQLSAHQYIKPSPGLNVDIPAAFRPSVASKAKLSLYEAYYLAHALANRPILERTNAGGTERYAAGVLLHFLALDSVEEQGGHALQGKTVLTRGGTSKTFADKLAFYNSQDFWLVAKFTDYVESELSPIIDCFEQVLGCPPIFVNDKGRQRLAEEQPSILAQFIPPASP